VQEMPISEKTKDCIMPKTIPVKAGCCNNPFMQYSIASLFDSYGNGDGDDRLLCHIAQRVIAQIEKDGFTIDCDTGLHNCSCIETITWKDGVWENNASGTSNEDEIYETVVKTLPTPIRETLLKLCLEGITINAKNEKE